VIADAAARDLAEARLQGDGETGYAETGDRPPLPNVPGRGRVKA
jgi:hypothetical protein